MEGTSGFKHARTGFGTTPHTKRPIDKQLKTVFHSATDATQEEVVLFTATFPCTVVGLRWSINQTQDGGTGKMQAWWAIVIVRDGESAGTLGTAVGDDTYTPEQNCLVFGASLINNNTDTSRNVGSTKTMRKFMGGDRLIFIVRGIATETTMSQGVIQFFCKT